MLVLDQQSSERPIISTTPGVVDWVDRCNQALARRWPEFVDCSSRMITEGPFLLNVLGPPPLRILDAAMGVGCETTFLTSKGYSVVGNEINSGLRDVALAHAKNADVAIAVTQHDWRVI